MHVYMYMYMHTRAYIYITHTHSNMHTHTCTHTNTCTCTHAHAHTHTHTHMHMNAGTHAHIHAQCTIVTLKSFMYNSSAMCTHLTSSGSLSSMSLGSGLELLASPSAQISAVTSMNCHTLDPRPLGHPQSPTRHHCRERSTHPAQDHNPHYHPTVLQLAECSRGSWSP